MKKLMTEQQFKQYIVRLVKESLEALGNYNFEEKEKDNSNDNSSHDNKSDDDSETVNNETEKAKRKRLQIEKFLGQPGVNPAQYAYKLYNVTPIEGKDTNEMKNARGLFMKKLHHEKNSDGYPYAFDSEETIKLYSMISGNELT